MGFDRRSRKESHERRECRAPWKQCNLCFRRFDRQVRYERHVRTVHPTPLTNSVAAPPAAPTLPPPLHTGPAEVPAEAHALPPPPTTLSDAPDLPAPPQAAPTEVPAEASTQVPAGARAEVPPEDSAEDSTILPTPDPTDTSDAIEPAVHPCPHCDKSYKRRKDLVQHLKAHSKPFKCPQCGSVFTRQFWLDEHVLKCQGKSNERVTCPRCDKVLSSASKLQYHLDKVHVRDRVCELCKQVFSRKKDFDRHLSECKIAHGYPQDEPDDSGVVWASRFGLQKDAAVHVLQIDEIDLPMCLIHHKDIIEEKVRRELDKVPQSIKWQLVVSGAASREQPAEAGGVEEVRKDVFLRSEMITVLKGAVTIQEGVEKAILEVQANSEHLNLQGSGWVISRIKTIELHIVRCSPLKGSSYIPTPSWIKNSKKTLVNIQNFGNHDCFRLSVVANKMIKDGRVKTKKFRQEKYKRFLCQLNMGNLEYEPMRVSDVRKFEILNPQISINILYVDCDDENEEMEGTKNKKKCIVPLYCTPERKEDHVTLLLVSRGEKNHFILVQDMHAFLSDQTKCKRRRLYCCYCLNTFGSNVLLDEHEKICKEFGAQKTEYARQGDFEKFDQRHFPKLQRVPFTAYYDWESALVPLSPSQDSDTVRTQQHVPVAYSIVVVNWQGKIVKRVSHAGDTNIAQHFVSTVFELEQELWDIRPDFPLDMSPEQQHKFEKSTKCFLCQKRFHDPSDRVRDHDHLEEKHNYRGAAHSHCNSGVKRTNFLPLIAHNAFRYDVHHIFLAFLQDPRTRGSHVLPKTHDSYRSVTLYIGQDRRSIKLLDSYQFFSSSLDDISKELQDQDLGLLFEAYPNPIHQQLLRQKGVYCYEHVQSYQQLCEETCLPPRESFYSSLSKTIPSEEEYARAQTVWEGLGCKTLLDYTMHYVQSDVLLLASFFTKFKSMTFRKYGIEVCHSVSASSLTWCQALKYTGAEVELISDPNMYQFFERQKRGGLACVMKRFSKANIPGTPDFSPDEDPKYIYLWDVNALYSFEMCKKLPVGEYRWMNVEEFKEINWEDVSETDTYGYTVEVDLEYGEELYDAHNEWPCAVEKWAIPREWYSPYQQELAKLLPEGQLKQEKLVAHFGPRKNYIVHGAVLARYLQLGLRVTRFHRGVCYRQEAWLKPYITGLMDARQQTTSPLEALALKLSSNATYGFLLRNCRFDRNVEIVTSCERLRKVVAKPNLKSFTLFAEDVVAVEKLPTKLKLKQCVSAGVSVLDLSKKTMLDLYWKLKNQFGKRMETLFTDTDSFGAEVTSHNINEELSQLKDILDTSGLHSDHPLYHKNNAKVPGFLKIEFGDQYITKFAAVRSKCWAVETVSQDQSKRKTVMKCKGVPQNALKSGIKFEDYKKCVFENVDRQVSFSSIRTDGKHGIFTVKQRKRALCNFDNKRWIESDGIRTRAFRPTDEFDENDLELLAVMTELANAQNSLSVN